MVKGVLALWGTTGSLGGKGGSGGGKWVEQTRLVLTEEVTEEEGELTMMIITAARPITAMADQGRSSL